jgi:hypothetical protein
VGSVELPSLADFASEGDQLQSNGPPADAGQSAERLFHLVRLICSRHGFSPLVSEFVYLSDPSMRKGTGAQLEIIIDSYVAATDEQAAFVLPKGNAPYYAAFARMMQRSKSGFKEPIGGHPNLWQEWRGKPKIGYVYFRASEATAPESEARYLHPLDDANPRRPSKTDLVLRQQIRELIEVSEYTSDLDEAFSRFVRYFLEAAQVYAEAAGERFLNPYLRLRRSVFIGIPFARPVAEAEDVNVAAALSALGLTPARGVILLLFVEPSSAYSPEQIHDLARALYLLMLEMYAKKAVGTPRRLISNIVKIVHDTGNIISTIKPGEIRSVFVQGRNNKWDQFEWDYILAEANAPTTRAHEQEHLLKEIVDQCSEAARLAQNHVTLVEIHGFGGRLRRKYRQEEDATFYNSVITPAWTLLSKKQVELQPMDSSIRQIVVPAGYLNSAYIIPVVNEILLNCSRYGLKQNDKVIVYIKVLISENDDDHDTFLIEFANAPEKQDKELRNNFEDFLPQINVRCSFSGGLYRQILSLSRMEQVSDDQVSEGWASLRRVSV